MTQIAHDDISFVGSGLRRPECVLAHKSGLLITPDWTEPGGVSLISRNGKVHRLLATKPDAGVDLPVRPNGIALEDGGTILMAHLGDEKGGIYRLWPDGRVEIVTDTIEGKPMPPTNFVTVDSCGRVLFTVSTQKKPRAQDYRLDANSGFIARHDKSGTHILADNIGYANECLLSQDERMLWVNETFARKLTCFDVVGDQLLNRKTIAEFDEGIFPDGLTPMSDGSLMVTSIVSNSVLSISLEGVVSLILQDADPKHLDQVEEAFQAGEMGRPHLDTIKSQKLRNISNLAFGGSDLKTAYLGNLLDNKIATFRSPVAGRPLQHWECDLGDLTQYM